MTDINDVSVNSLCYKDGYLWDGDSNEFSTIINQAEHNDDICKSSNHYGKLISICLDIRNFTDQTRQSCLDYFRFNAKVKEINFDYANRSNLWSFLFVDPTCKVFVNNVKQVFNAKNLNDVKKYINNKKVKCLFKITEHHPCGITCILKYICPYIYEIRIDEDINIITNKLIVKDYEFSVIKFNYKCFISSSNLLYLVHDGKYYVQSNELKLIINKKINKEDEYLIEIEPDTLKKILNGPHEIVINIDYIELVNYKYSLKITCV